MCIVSHIPYHVSHVKCHMSQKETASDGADKETDRRTYGHPNSKTESTQWADSVKIRILAWIW